MNAKECDRESRRDTWFENRLVFSFFFKGTFSKKCVIFRGAVFVKKGKMWEKEEYPKSHFLMIIFWPDEEPFY